MDSSDSELCRRIKNGDEAAFRELQEKYKGLVSSICMKELQSGWAGLHTRLSVCYEHLEQDIESIVWQALYEQALSGIKFDDKDSFIKLINTIARNKVHDIKKKSRKNRSMGAINGVFNSFHSMDREEDTGSGTPLSFELPYPVDNDIDYDKFMKLLADELDEKEQYLLNQLLKLLNERWAEGNGKKPTQHELAELLDISDRTVRNRMNNIREKAKSVILDVEVQP